MHLTRSQLLLKAKLLKTHARGRLTDLAVGIALAIEGKPSDRLLALFDSGALWVCDECGSPRVQAQGWYDLNTGIFLDGEGADGLYCSRCGEYAGVVLRRP